MTRPSLQRLRTRVARISGTAPKCVLLLADNREMGGARALVTPESRGMPRPNLPSPLCTAWIRASELVHVRMGNSHPRPPWARLLQGTRTVGHAHSPDRLGAHTHRIAYSTRPQGAFKICETVTAPPSQLLPHSSSVTAPPSQLLPHSSSFTAPPSQLLLHSFSLTAPPFTAPPFTASPSQLLPSQLLLHVVVWLQPTPLALKLAASFPLPKKHARIRVLGVPLARPHRCLRSHDPT